MGQPTRFKRTVFEALEFGRSGHGELAIPDL